jgi:hypothetical protein
VDEGNAEGLLHGGDGAAEFEGAAFWTGRIGRDGEAVLFGKGAVGSAAWSWRYWAWLRRSLPVRLVTLSGALRLTTTETVILAPDGAGFSPAGWIAAAGTKGAFSLPGRTARGEAERGGAGFFFVVFVVFLVFVVIGKNLQIWG